MPSTPGGRPASSPSLATASADSGVCSAGFSTIVQPAASAGAALRVTIAAGKFQGVIPAVTPIGSLVTTIRRSCRYVGIVSPYTRFASSPNHSRNEAAYSISTRDSAIGFPCSVVSSRASGSAFSSIRSDHRRMILARSLASSPRHAGSASAAARRARVVSAAPMRGTSRTSSPVAGSSTRNVSPESDSSSSSGRSATVSPPDHRQRQAPNASAISAHVATVATFCIA